MELTILMPCLNEAETLVQCVTKARRFLDRSRIDGEVLIADNGSSDGSQDIARRLGARVIDVAEPGYGSALASGIQQANGIFVIMGDSDDSYDFQRLEGFVEKLREGFDLVMGNRFRGGIMPGAMPPLHRYLGNPVLSFIGRLFFRSCVGDFHCGLRGFRKDAITRLDLRTPGMEFASEMVVKATLHGLKLTEVPTMLHPDGRSRAPHLRSWRDGWRHLRFLLLFSPRWLFLYPGALLLGVGLLVEVLLFPGPLAAGGIVLDIHTMLYGAMLTIVGLQMVWFSIFSKVIGMQKGILPEDARIRQILTFVTLERGLMAAAVLFGVGILLAVSSVVQWEMTGFAKLDPTSTMRVIIPAVTMIIGAIELAMASFMLGVIGLPARKGSKLNVL